VPLTHKLAKIVFGAHVATGATLWPRRLKSLLGMGVATFRLVAALLTILGVWINLDTFFYLRNKPMVDDNTRPSYNYKRPNPQNKFDGFITMPAADEATVENVEKYPESPTAVEYDGSEEVIPQGEPYYRTDPNRFLIPLLSMGPNNQLEGFLESVFLAIKLNRTLCIPPFYKHKTDDLNEAVSSQLRLDSKELSNLMTVCETPDIKKNCPNIDTVWVGTSGITCGLALQKRYNVFTNKVGINHWYSPSKCRPFDGIPLYPAETAGKFQVRSTAKADMIKLFNDNMSGRCVVWLYPFHTISNFRSAVMSHLLHKNDPGDRQLAVDVVKHVKRPESIRHLVTRFLKEKADGKPIVSVHWRYDQQDWLLHCDRLPDGQADKSCRNVAQMLDNPSLAVDNFRIFLRGIRNSLQQDLAVYIAAPLDENIMSTKLLAAIQDLGETALSSKELLPYLIEEGFSQSDIHDVLSTTEQEICFQSHIFLYSQISTWSFNLVYQRKVDGKNSIDNFYVFGGQAVAAATHQAVEYFKDINFTKT
jgi:hypothetical protein